MSESFKMKLPSLIRSLTFKHVNDNGTKQCPKVLAEMDCVVELPELLASRARQIELNDELPGGSPELPPGQLQYNDVTIGDLEKKVDTAIEQLQAVKKGKFNKITISHS